MRRILWWVVFTVGVSFLAAQRQAETWHIGNGIGISFAGDQPVLVQPSAQRAFEGVVSYGDAQGDLLFYTNGGGRPPGGPAGFGPGTIWNRNHQPMYDLNGTQGGGISAIQSSLAFPDPAQDSVYYLFTMEENEFAAGGTPPDQPEGRGLSYFKIDMRLNGSLGGVTTADQRVFVPAFESLSGTPDGKGGYWVYCVTAPPAARSLVRVHVTAAGVDDPVVTDLGIVTLDGPIKISPAGDWLYYGGRLYPLDQESGEIDPAGQVSLFSDSPLTASFTADSRFFYSVRPALATGNRLVRYDVRAADIAASEETVAFLPLSALNRQMQLAADGRLYFIIAEFAAGRFGLWQITCPSGPSPTVTPYVIDFTEVGGQGANVAGLPNYVDAIFSYTGLADSIFLPVDSLEFCAQPPPTIAARLPGSGFRWSSGADTPSIDVTASGTYVVTYVDECERTVTDSVVVDLIELTAPQLLPLGEPQALRCPGDTLLLLPQGGTPVDSVIWSDGVVMTQRVFVLSDDPDQVFSATVYYRCGSAELSYFPTLTPPLEAEILLGNDFDNRCPGDTLTLSTVGQSIASVQWFDGQNSPNITVTLDSGMVYSDIITGTCGDTLELSVTVDLSNCPVVCEVAVPEVFTPNGDGRNDVFKPFSGRCALENFQCVVYNRWGRKVFSSSDPTRAWRGEEDGKPQPADVYLYRMSFTYPNNPEVVVREGEVTLLR
ncbi:MAG: gliding motility-associated C-terminal domain-containing protein [Saprospiraceae bacterium]